MRITQSRKTRQLFQLHASYVRSGLVQRLAIFALSMLLCHQISIAGISKISHRGGGIKLWDLVQKKEVNIFGGDSLDVYAVAFSPDGKFLASGRADKTIEIWELRTGKIILQLTGHSESIRSVAFSPDGKLLASGSGDKTIKLWDLNAGKELFTLTGHSGGVQSVAFSADGKLLASASPFEGRLWDIRTRRGLRVLAKDTLGEYRSVGLSLDGQLLATSGRDGKIKVWEVNTGSVLKSFQGEGSDAVAFSHDSKLVASADVNKIRVYDLSAGKEVQSIGYSPPFWMVSLAFCPDGKTLAGGSIGEKVTIWDVGTGLPLDSLYTSNSVVSVAFSPEGKHLACASGIESFETIHVPRVYLISIGINAYQDPTPNKSSFSESDAMKFSKRIESEIPGAQPLDTVKSWSGEPPRIYYANMRFDGKRLLGKDAAFGAIRDAFYNVIKKSQPEDIFVFYFAGCSLEDFLTYDSYRDTVRNRWDRAISINLLKYWLNNVRALKQLMVFDAGNTKDFGFRFVLETSETNPLTAGLSERKRVVLCPNGYGMETPEGGVFTRIVCNLPKDLRLISDSFENRDRLEFHLLKNQLEMFNQESRYVNVFFERDYTDFLKWIEKPGNASRGAELVNKPPPESDTLKQKNIALLIGTDKYEGKPEWRDLRNPVDDVTTIGRELAGSFGFDTTILVNPTRDDIRRSLKALRQTPYDSTSQLVIVISGHGVYDESTTNGFLVCRDSKANEEYYDSYLSYNKDIEGLVNSLPYQHVLLVLDACYGGTFDRKISESGSKGDEEKEQDEMYRGKSNPELIKQSLKYKSRLYLTAGGKEYVPDGQPGHHSPFASKLIEALRKHSGKGGVLTMNQLRAELERVSPTPMAGSFGSHDVMGDFIFVAK